MIDDKWFNELVASYFNIAMRNAHPALLLADSDKVKILAPAYAIERLIKFNTDSIRGFDPGSINKYCGYRIEVGYENKIIIFHEDAALFNRSESTYYELELR